LSRSCHNALHLHLHLHLQLQFQVIKREGLHDQPSKLSTISHPSSDISGNITAVERKKMTKILTNKIVMIIPLKEGYSDCPIYDSMVETWQRSYPGIYVWGELVKLRDWNDRQPQGRRTTPARIGYYIADWLRRAEERLIDEDHLCKSCGDKTEIKQLGLCFRCYKKQLKRGEKALVSKGELCKEGFLKEKS